MKEQTHCQSCGAPIQIGECKCPYCDVPYIFEIDVGRVEKLYADNRVIMTAHVTEQLYAEAIKAMREYSTK